MTVKPSEVLSEESRAHFWDVVRACWREFHHAPRTVLARVTKLRQETDAASIKEGELLFDSEPFNVACRIDGRRLPIERYLERYLEMRDGKGKQHRESRAV